MSRCTTLIDRVRDHHPCMPCETATIVRAELKRLARQVKRLERYTPETSSNTFLYYEDVLDTIEEATR